MKSKLLIIVMAIVLFVNSYDLRVFASNTSHENLIEYKGYAEALYESVVTEKAFLGGSYTKNVEYVKKTIDEIKSGANSFFNEMINIEGPLDIYTKIYSGGQTAGEWIKRFLDKFNQKEQEKADNVDFTSSYIQFFRLYSGGVAITPEAARNYNISFEGNGGSSQWVDERQYAYVQVSTTNFTACNNKNGYRFMFMHSSPVYICDIEQGNRINQKLMSDRASAQKTADTLDNVRVELNTAISLGLGNVRVIEKATNQPVIFPPVDTTNNFITIKKYIDEDTTPSKVKPLNAHLVCPNGQKVKLHINGTTFVDNNGTVLQVDKNGTATVDSSICNLVWEKPDFSYSDDGKVIIEQDGKSYELEGDEPFDDEIEPGCGTICAIGKLLSGLGSIAKAIAAIPLKILDGLFDVVKKILIPDENFWSSNLDGLKSKFFNDELKEVQQGVESLENVGGGQFGDITGSLMGVDNLTIIDSSSINMSIEKIHSWVRGFFYPLLLFFNINQMYRVIRGTSLIGIGGKKEE